MNPVKNALLDIRLSWLISAMRQTGKSPDQYANGLMRCVQDIEDVLSEHFPGWVCEECGEVLGPNNTRGICEECAE